MQPNGRAVIYARLSVNRTDETLAIDRQVKDCTALIERKGWELVGTYTDNNRSAWHEGTKRPGYDALLEAIQRGEVNVVVVYETDRLARRLRTMLELFDLLLETGVVVHSTKSGLLSLDSPMNIAQAQMKAVFAEQYVNDARDKNLRKRLELAQNGIRHATSRIYGWEDDGITVRESEAVVIREIVQRLLDGDTGTHIARDLNARGIKTVKGAHWTGIGVKVCAKRASNAGLRSHHGELYEGQWQPIITREEWERVCNVVSRPVSTWKRGKGRKYPFTGFVVCDVCKRPLSVAMGRSNPGTAAYRCDSRRRGVEAEYVPCGKVQRAQVPVDYLIKEALIARLDGDGLAKVMAEQADRDSAVSSVLEEMRTQRQRIDELVDDYASGLLNKQQLTRAKAVAETRMRELEAQARAMTGAVALNRADFSKGVRHMVETADVYLLRDIAELLIKEVRIKPQPKKGFRLRILEVGGHRYRFDADLVELDFRV